MPISANMVTTASMLSGLAAAVVLMTPTRWTGVWAGLFLTICYVLDNCDGEIARLKGQTSEFGRRFDSFADWIVHIGFFAGLGFGLQRAESDPLWGWLAAAAVLGGTINYAIGLYFDRHDKATVDIRETSTGRPKGAWQWTLFVFRELTRADFCFLVLILGALDLLWMLLPAGAVGAQIYWMGQFSRAARGFHT